MNLNRAAFSFLALTAGFLVFKSTVGLAAATPTSPSQPIPTIGVQVDKYLGKWYDVRSIPNDFQKGCTNTTAEYALEPEGTLRVTNACRVVDDQGVFVKDNSVVGRGWIKNKDNSVLKVSFTCALGICVEPLAGDYWILELGPLDQNGLYSWAIVGGPTREFGWVLSRQSTMDTTTMTEIEGLLRAQGYDPATFRMTPQNQR